MKILDFQRHTVTIRDKPGILFRSTIVFLDPPKRMHVTFAGYSYIPIGISLYSRFIWEYSPENSWATFAEYSGNISWERSTNIAQAYICSVSKCEYKRLFI